MQATSLVLALLVAGTRGYAGLSASPKGVVSTANTLAEQCPPVAGRLEVAAPPRAEPKPKGGGAAVPAPLDLWPSPAGPEGPKGPSVFRLNQGRGIDVLRRDYPRIFTDKPDLSIFADDIELHDPSGKRLSGKKQYEKVFDMLRFLRRTTMQDASVAHRVVADDKTIRIRWSAKLWMRDPTLGITTLPTGEPALVHLDGVSVYELNSDGLIRSHRLENIVMTGGLEQAEKVQLAFAWPTPGFATPELARPFFRSLHDAAATSVMQHAPSAAPDGAAPRAAAHGSPARRTPAPVMSEETPMQRAARERAEDAAKQQRLEELRRPKGEGDGKGSLFGLSGPTPCETSYDCEAPQVCCDLLFASVCCSGGLLIPTRGGGEQGVLQRQAIPIPVERDNDGLPGGGFPGPPAGDRSGPYTF